jgi:hypothetical protein
LDRESEASHHCGEFAARRLRSKEVRGWQSQLADIETKIGRTFRTTGITIYLTNGITTEPKSPLFRALNGKTKFLSDRLLDRKDAFGPTFTRFSAILRPGSSF